MGDYARKIVQDADKIIEMLNKAFADEWLAYYQYWIAAKVVEGPMRPNVEAELDEHAKEELEHADKLANRIVELGGTPLKDPKTFGDHSTCGYDAPEKEDVESILADNVKAEQCAIQVYHDLMEFCKDRDPVTYHLALDILKDELEHEQDLQDIQADLSHRT